MCSTLYEPAYVPGTLVLSGVNAISAPTVAVLLSGPEGLEFSAGFDTSARFGCCLEGSAFG